MQIQYARLPSGEWKVEAWMWVNDAELVWSCCFSHSRGWASWEAVKAVARGANVWSNRRMFRL